MLLSVEANLQDADNELTQEESEYAAQLALDLVRGRRRKEKFAGVFLPPPPGKKGKPRAVSQARPAEEVADAESTATAEGTSEGSERAVRSSRDRGSGGAQPRPETFFVV